KGVSKMTIFEDKIADMKKYTPELTRQADFKDFWKIAMKELFEEKNRFVFGCENKSESFKNAKGYNVSFDFELIRYVYPLKLVEIYDVVLEGSDGTPLHGWYIKPVWADQNKKVPALVRFHGYSSNKGKISELLLWALQGYAVLAMDVRGQCGDTCDGRVYSTGSFSGWMTKGLKSPTEYYYRQVYIDCVHQIEALARRPEVDENNIGLFGNSQGGALALVSAALLNKYSEVMKGITSKVRAVNAGIPFMCDFKRAYKEKHNDGPLAEFDWYFRMYDSLHNKEEQIFKTLSYFDTVNFASWVNSSVLVYVNLLDTACPPATIFGLFNHLCGEKHITVFPDYAHESIDYHVEIQIAFFARQFLV
ncbi:MAG: acetylxylan esterase, partial [Eubacteriales bacterium]